MKILYNCCLHFARQDGQDGKNQKENHATKGNKLPKDKNTADQDSRYKSLVLSSYLKFITATSK